MIMIESLLKKYNDDETILPEIVASFEKMDADELISIYLGYSSSVYFIRYNNISKVLELISNKIVQKLDSISLIKVIEIYSDIYLKTLDATERLERNSNVIKSNHYTIGNRNPQLDLFYLKMAFKYIDKLHTMIFNYLDSKLKMIDSIEKDEIISYLNQKITENEEEIRKREEILHDEDKINLLTKYGRYGNSRFEVCFNIDPTDIKIKNEDVYKSLRAIALDNVSKK